MEDANVSGGDDSPEEEESKTIVKTRNYSDDQTN
jgi:hypothetical protein